MIDALGYEPQFIDHLAPIWRALPDRGTFHVDPALVARARSRGVDPMPTPVARTRPAPSPVGGQRAALVASAGDIKVGRRLGYGRFVFVEHGIGQSYGARREDIRHASYAGGADRDDVELNIVPNETCARRWRAAYPRTPVAVVGCAKLDELPRKSFDPTAPVIAITFHWSVGLGISGYAGTAFGDFLPALPALAARWPVLGHAHPKDRWPREVGRHYARLGIEQVEDFADICRRADVLVADNTSVLYEFAATGRPVVVMNARHWSRRVSYGLRFWDAAGVGPNADRADELVGAVERALELRPEDIAAREAALDVVYAYRTGAAERAAAAITAWLGDNSVSN